MPTLDAFDHFTLQHNRVRDLYEQALNAEDPDDRATKVGQLSDELGANIDLEESTAFVPLELQEGLRDSAIDYRAEKLGLRQLMKKVRDFQGDDQAFRAAMEDLNDLLADHFQREETELFALARHMLSEDQLAAILRAVESYPRSGEAA